MSSRSITTVDYAITASRRQFLPALSRQATITSDSIIPRQILSDVVGRRAGQQALLAALGDGWRIGTCPVRADAVRGEKRLILQHLAEEPLGRIEIAVCGEQEVDGLT